MNWVAIRMLTGDTAKYLGIVFGVAFATLLMGQQLAIFCGLMRNTTSQVRDIDGGDIWVMDRNVQFVDDVKPMSENKLLRVRGEPGVKWAVRLYKGIARGKLSDGNFQQVIVIGLDDATLVGAHSDKEHASPTWKRGFGFHPLLAYLDATGEALAGLLRPGNAGSGTATDHVTVLSEALAQLPLEPLDREVIVRADSAGWSHGFVNECRQRHVRFVIGHQLTIGIAKILVDVPERAWRPAISADGTDWRDHAEVAEITDLVSDVFDATRAWPSGLRMIARREQPHPGAQLTFTDIDGNTYIDFNLADTSMFTGYGVEAISEVVAKRANDGPQFLLPTQDAVEVATRLAARLGLPFWQFTLSARRSGPPAP